MRESMTPRERWLAVLQGDLPDRIPMDYWATEEVSVKLVAHLGVPDLDAALDQLHVDRPRTVAGHYIGPTCPADTDVFGIRRRSVSYGAGTYDEVMTHPLAEFKTVEEIEANYCWPDPDWWDYSKVAEQLVGWEDYPIRGGGSEPFLLYKALRGDEQAFMDLALNPAIAHYCLDKLFELAYQNTLRIYEAIPSRVDITYVAEDMGSQEGLLFSPKQIKTFLIPRMKRIIDLAHSAGAYVFHHSDGAVRKILPTMIETGIDVLNPIQWKCVGMEREGLKRDFGQDLVFHGGVDNQYTLAFGSVDEVRQEVRDDIRILGAGGGYILAPCHNIQAVSPAENIVAMYETGYQEGWY